MLAAAVLLCRAAAVLLLCRAASSTSSAQPTGGVTTLDCASAIAIAAEARAFSRASVRIVLSASVRLFAATVVAVATFATTRVVEPPPRGLSPGGAFPATVADEMTVACCPPGACLDSVTCDVAMQLPARHVAEDTNVDSSPCAVKVLAGCVLSPARRVVVGIVCAPPNAPTSRDARVAADVAPPPPPPAELLACAVEAVFGTAMELEHPADARRGVAAPPPPPAAAAFPFAAAAFAARSALNDATVGFSAGAGFAALLLLLLLVACR